MVNVLKNIKDDDRSNCDFVFDNYFTKYKLMEKLSDDRILGTGTVKENTISGANQIFEYKNALKKTERGTHDFCRTKFIYLALWNDNSE